MSKMKIITQSGAEYIIDGRTVTGGSKQLINGKLCKINLPVQIGKQLLILTPERAKQNPTALLPGVISTPVVSIEILS